MKTKYCSFVLGIPRYPALQNRRASCSLPRILQPTIRYEAGVGYNDHLVLLLAGQSCARIRTSINPSERNTFGPCPPRTAIHEAQSKQTTIPRTIPRASFRKRLGRKRALPRNCSCIRPVSISRTGTQQLWQAATEKCPGSGSSLYQISSGILFERESRSDYWVNSGLLLGI